jgi:hypothetical protein
MASVKLKNKDLLDKLQAKIVLETGNKLSQQEILDKSVEFAYNKLPEFIQENVKTPQLTKEILKYILDNPYDGPLYHLDKSDDELLYGDWRD